VSAREDKPASGGGPKQRTIPDPPEFDQSKGRRSFWFVLALLVVALASMIGVATLNTLADPYGSLGTHLLPTVTTSDRTVKADAIESLKQPPQLVVLGSSRSMRYEPVYFREKTGLRTFNAGVNGIGGTADAWAMTQFIHEVWPQARPAYFWLLDVESFVPSQVGARTANEPRLAKYVGQASAGKGFGELVRAVVENRLTLFSLATAKDSLRLIVYRDKAKSMESKYRKQIMADGVLTQRLWSKKEWGRRYPRSAKRYSDLYRNVYERLDPRAKKYFEDTLAFMNDQGKTPLIVLTPINPKLLKVVAPLGWHTRHRQVVDYVESLQAKYRFVFVDMTDIRTFGADPVQFYDGVHMTTINTRRAIDYVLQKTGGLPE
jgi:hypothetical protein